MNGYPEDRFLTHDKEKIEEILRPFDELIEEQVKKGDTYFAYLLRRTKQELQDGDPNGFHQLAQMKMYYDDDFMGETAHKEYKEEKQAILEKIRQALES